MPEKKKQYMDEQVAKDTIIAIGCRMYNRNFVAANDGNISIKTGDNEFWVTPTGVSKGFMTVDSLIKVNINGDILEGNGKPSSELKMHLRVYKENATVQAVTHAHPIHATALSIARKDLTMALVPEAIVNLGVVPVAPYATPGTTDVPDSIAPFCNSHNAVLLANHGALTWGGNIHEAYFRLESLEHYSTILINSCYILKQPNLLTTKEVDDLIQIRQSMGITTGGIPSGVEQ